MIKLLVGNKGSGKTKQIIEMINTSVETLDGCIVCIEKGMKYTYNINSAVRLIDVEDYSISGYTMLYGFLMGVMAGNYDIQEIYIDGILKIGNQDVEGLGTLLDQIEKIAQDKLKVVVTVSTDIGNLNEEVKKYLV